MMAQLRYYLKIPLDHYKDDELYRMWEDLCWVRDLEKKATEKQ
jgi:hypothetical protein